MILEKMLRFYQEGSPNRKRLILIVSGVFFLVMIILIPILVLYGSGLMVLSSAKGLSAVASADDTDRLFQSLQGTWLAIAKDTSAPSAPFRMVISGHTMHFPDFLETGEPSIGVNGKLAVADRSFQVNATHSPAWIDTDPGTADLHLGVVEIDGDSLKCMFSQPGDRRPNDFGDFTGKMLKSQGDLYQRVK